MPELLSDEDWKKLHPASNAYKEQKLLRQAAANGNPPLNDGITKMNNNTDLAAEATKNKEGDPFNYDANASLPTMNINDVLPQNQGKPQFKFPEGEDPMQPSSLRNRNNFTEAPEARVSPKSNTAEYIVFPDKVILKPINSQKFRLGLEATKEGFLRLPGTLYRWEPSVIGKAYATGLELISPETRAQLSAEVGHELDFEFYVDLGYRMDGSNRNGHHMFIAKAIDKIIYLAMLKSHLIAQTESEWKTGKKPQADWYMENLELEAEILSVEKDHFAQVFQLYGSLSTHKTIAVAKVLGIAVRAVSPKVASNLLYQKLLEKGTGYRKIWDRFIEICLWSDAKVNVFEEMEDALAGNLIRRNGAQDFVYGDVILGSTKDQIVSKLLMPENQDLRMALKGKLQLRH